LSGMRGSLRARLAASPLMDGARFAVHVEAAYREVWRHWCDQAQRIAPSKRDSGDVEPGSGSAMPDGIGRDVQSIA
jgi:protein O-GlcNAc transferase